ncbi:MAG: polysaccharide pyruvyl transferase family protein [Synergistaceae bacterium]|nr:polysaccharide pyruvyl transferase family protein [Synergistaceae bacterium]
MKIDLITLQAVNNYGSVLQTFATQEFFREHGCEVRILNYKKDASISDGNPFKAAVKFPFRLVTQCLQPFDAFRREHLNITGKLRTSMKDFADYESDADAFCTGSDQVWNSWWNRGILPELYLAFAPEGSYKFAFSASFGKTEIDAEEVAETQKWIDGYRHISVREDSAAKILEEQYHYSRAVHVPDPTLCLSGNAWRGYVKTTNGGGGYGI